MKDEACLPGVHPVQPGGGDLAAGHNIQSVMAAVNVSKGSVSGYLNELEAAIGCRIVRGASRTGHKGENLKTGMADAGLYQERQHGLPE